MRLRSHRRNLAVRSQSVGPADRSGAPRFTRIRRIRRCIRTGALLAVVGLTPLARGGRPRWCGRARWWLLLAGGMLTAAGINCRVQGPAPGRPVNAARAAVRTLSLAVPAP
jgi:hypothetical protein